MFEIIAVVVAGLAIAIAIVLIFAAAKSSLRPSRTSLASSVAPS
jgi:hypothetical protein